MIELRRMFGSFAVDDIAAAKRFYEDTLGMKVAALGEDGPLWLHGPGGHDTMVYVKPDHVPAGFTVLNLSVPDIERAVDELASLGVRFERYEGFQADDRGIYHGEGHWVAWFTDPAGNSLSLVQEG